MKTIWLASYPKSGNTWMRTLIGALHKKPDETPNINELAEAGGIASARQPFDYYTLLESGLLPLDAIDRLRPDVYALMARHGWDEEDALEAARPARFIKVHDAYTTLPDGRPLLGGAAAADGAVVIVRDPRDVAPSLAHHNGCSLKQAVRQLNARDTAYCAAAGRQHQQLRQKLLDWSGHVESWLNQADLPVLLVRYEDMQADAAGILGKVMDFAGDPQPPEKLAQAAAMSSFSVLSEMEKQTGFGERSSRSPNGRFFRRGQSGGWKDELDAELVARLEAAHGAVMARLGYELTAAQEQLQEMMP